MVCFCDWFHQFIGTEFCPLTHTHNTSAVVSSQSANMKTVSKCPDRPFKPSQLLLHFFRSFVELHRIFQTSIWHSMHSGSSSNQQAYFVFSVGHLGKENEERKRTDPTSAWSRRSNSGHLSDVCLSSDRGCSQFHLCFYFFCSFRGNEASRCSSESRLRLWLCCAEIAA